MFRVHLIGIVLLTAFVPAAETSAESYLESADIHQLEKRLEDIDADLAQLAPTSLRSGVGAVGYQSASHNEAKNTEWVQIDLGAEFPIDQIVLVPSIGRDSNTGLQADGFPLEFRLLAGTSNTTNELAFFSAADKLLPRVAPVTVPFNLLTASWVRVECTLLSPRNWTPKEHALLFSEIMVFSGRVNVALQKRIHASTSESRSAARHEKFLVDGFVPYLMDAAHGEKSPARAFPLRPVKNPHSLTIDLGALFPVNQINLHAIDLGHTIPESTTDGYAIPRKLSVTGATHPDFKDQTLLFNYEMESIYDAGPIIRRNFPETQCRYVRIAVIDPRAQLFLGNRHPRMGFAEIEILSEGGNVALGRPVTPSSDLKGPLLAFKRMTDGSNFYGEILPLRDWMNQLALRHDLETERPNVSEELSRRYARQKANLKLATWLIALLLGGAVILILVEQLLRQRAINKIRERIAANLHDELGANLHAIGILGTYAKRVLTSPEKLSNTVDEIKSLTDRTGEATRYCTGMLSAKQAHENLPDDLRRSAQRIIANLECKLSIQGEAMLKSLPPRTRKDLFLFYKESLININRHADATQVTIDLTAEPKNIYLRISDNGCGVCEDEQNEIPSSLKRRAKMLKGNISMENSETGGTQITLEFRPRRSLRLPQRSISQKD